MDFLARKAEPPLGVTLKQVSRLLERRDGQADFIIGPHHGLEVLDVLEILVSSGIELALNQVQRMGQQGAIIAECRSPANNIEVTDLDYVWLAKYVQRTVKSEHADHTGFLHGVDQIES